MFTRKEHALFADPYFRIIGEEQQYIEIQSLNTGHCWNVFKNQFESVNKIKLYHKHKETDSYYHDHKLINLQMTSCLIPAGINTNLHRQSCLKENGPKACDAPTVQETELQEATVKLLTF